MSKESRFNTIQIMRLLSEELIFDNIRLSKVQLTKV